MLLSDENSENLVLSHKYVISVLDDIGEYQLIVDLKYSVILVSGADQGGTENTVPPTGSHWTNVFFLCFMLIKP